MKMLYAPPPIFGLFHVEPVEVEVLELPATVGNGMALIRHAVPPDALIHLLAGVTRETRNIERLVIASDLKPL